MVDESTEPLVSVIVPTLNEGKIISKFLKVFLEQDYKNFELIIVDGQSSDNTASIVTQYMAKDPRVKLVFEMPKIGVGNARNIGFQMSRGQIILFEDVDWIEIDRAFLTGFIKVFQDPQVLMVARKRVMNFDGLNYFERFFSIFNITMRTYPEWGFPGYYMAYRRELLNKVGNYEPKLFWGEDRDFLKRALSLNPKLSIGEPFYSASDIHFFNDFLRRYRSYGKNFLQYETKNVSKLTFVHLAASILCVLTPLAISLGIFFPQIGIYGLLPFFLVILTVYSISFHRMRAEKIPKKEYLIALFLPFLALLQGWSFTYGMLESKLHKKSKKKRLW